MHTSASQTRARVVVLCILRRTVQSRVINCQRKGVGSTELDNIIVEYTTLRTTENTFRLEFTHGATAQKSRPYACAQGAPLCLHNGPTVCATPAKHGAQRKTCGARALAQNKQQKRAYVQRDAYGVTTTQNCAERGDGWDSRSRWRDLPKLTHRKEHDDDDDDDAGNVRLGGSEFVGLAGVCIPRATTTGCVAGSTRTNRNQTAPAAAEAAEAAKATQAFLQANRSQRLRRRRRRHNNTTLSMTTGKAPEDDATPHHMPPHAAT